jgi:hypothetical protein
MRKSIAIAAGLSLAFGTASLAGAESEKEMMSGQVTEKQGTTLTIRNVAGSNVDVRTTDETTIRGPEGAMQMDDIDAGDRVRVTSMAGAQPGERVATEIEVQSSGEAGGMAPEYGEDPRQLMPDENPEKGIPDEVPEAGPGQTP